MPAPNRKRLMVLLGLLAIVAAGVGVWRFLRTGAEAPPDVPAEVAAREAELRQAMQPDPAASDAAAEPVPERQHQGKGPVEAAP